MAQRQWRSDDTDPWLYNFGTGSDGDGSINTSTDAPIDSACSGTTGTTSLTATNASFAAGQLILIHQTRGTAVGGWELNKIASYVAGTITTTHNLTMTYTNSGASVAQVLVMKQYNNLTINSAQTLTAKAYDGTVGGIVVKMANASITVTGNIVASGANGATSATPANPTNGGGYRGGKSTTASNAPGQGEGSAGAGGTDSQSANGNGAGNGSHNGGSYNYQGTGGGGGNSSAGGNGTGTFTSGTGGSAVGNAGLTALFFGGGGGGCANVAGTTIYSGGNGGGIIFLIAPTITVTGTLTSKGGNGGAGSYAGADATQLATASGGGAGGSILIKGQTVVLGSSLVTANLGSKATGTNSGNGRGNQNSGDGSDGRIHLDYLTSFTGTTSPTLDSRQDNSLISDTGFLAFM